ncbi:MAG: hypothetical protein GY809_22900 [Planctomycetes bacterium]|nr:hypothetical protein [Planctomycetota bacterium]
MAEIEADCLEPLLTVAQDVLEANVRVSTLGTAAYFPLSRDGWQRIARLTHDVVRQESPGSIARREPLKLAAKIPLLSLRKRMRDMAELADEPDWM